MRAIFQKSSLRQAVAAAALTLSLTACGGDAPGETSGAATAAPTAEQITAMRDELAAQQPRFFAAMEEHFPEEFEAVVAKLATVAESSQGERTLEAAQSVAAFRQENASYLQTAPEEALDTLIDDQTDLVRVMLIQEGPEACGAFARFGLGALSSSSFINQLGSELDAMAARSIDAMAAGRDNPVARDTASAEDWEAFTSSFSSTEQGASDWAVLQGNADGNLCEAVIRFNEALLAADTEAGLRVKAANVATVASN